MSIDNYKKLLENIDPEIDFRVGIWFDIVDLIYECGYRPNVAWDMDDPVDSKNYNRIGKLAADITEKAKKVFSSGD